MAQLKDGLIWNHKNYANEEFTITLLLFYVLLLALLLQKSQQPGRDDVLIPGQSLLM